MYVYKSLPLACVDSIKIAAAVPGGTGNGEANSETNAEIGPSVGVQFAEPAAVSCHLSSLVDQKNLFWMRMMS